jgi:hypothetical protein
MEGHYNSTAETQQFDREWEHAKRKQDAQLDRIEKGISTLGDMARGMQEELDKQNPVIDDIDLQMDKVTSRLKNNNMRLKGLVTQVSPDAVCCMQPESCKASSGTAGHGVADVSWCWAGHPASSTADAGCSCRLTCVCPTPACCTETLHCPCQG